MRQGNDRQQEPVLPALYTKQEAMEMLGVGEKTFMGLAISYVKIGKRRRYAAEDIQAFIRRSREEPPCLSPAKGKARRITGMTSPSAGIGFEEAVKLIASQRQKQ
ncbi:MAG: helix-turn-helix domain-containing protein [Rickettsiales bacterium]